MPRDKIQFFHVAEKILHPERGPFPDGDKLRGLVMGIAQRGRIPVLPGKGGQIFQNRQDFPPQKPQGVPVENQVGIVGDITACGPQMENSGGGRGGFPVGVDMGHDIVADFPFPFRREREINIADMVFQFGHLFRRNGQAQLGFRPGQFHP